MATKAGKRFKQETVETTVEAAISDARTDLEELAGEMTDWFDNMPEGLQGSQTGSTVEEAANTLGDIQLDVEPPEATHDLEVEYVELRPYGRKPQPRWMRASNIGSMLEATAEVLEGWADGQDAGKREEGEEPDMARSIASDLRDAASNLEGVEFPSMYGG